MAKENTRSEATPEETLPARVQLPQRRAPDRTIDVAPHEVWQDEPHGEHQRVTLEGVLLRYALLSAAVILVSLIVSVFALAAFG